MEIVNLPGLGPRSRQWRRLDARNRFVGHDPVFLPLLPKSYRTALLYYGFKAAEFRGLRKISLQTMIFFRTRYSSLGRYLWAFSGSFHLCTDISSTLALFYELAPHPFLFPQETP
jgi:hypothetical protein